MGLCQSLRLSRDVCDVFELLPQDEALAAGWSGQGDPFG